MARTIAITGATSGLGQALAIHLARAGDRVLAVGRDPTRAEETRALGGERVEIVLGDLSTVAGARETAARIAALADRLDALVDNAGGRFETAGETVDGVERTFALNVLAPAVLSRALRPRLAAARGRVVEVATSFLDWFPFDPGELVKPAVFDPMKVYARCKTAQVVLACEHAAAWAPDGVSVVSMSPGIVLGTRFGGGQSPALQRLGGPVMRLLGLACTMDEAVRRFEVALSPAIPSGAYLQKGQVSALPKAAADPAVRARVMAILAERGA